MKTYAYIILALLIFSIVSQPLWEMGLLFKDRVAVTSALSNSSRVAKSSSYDDAAMRDADAVLKEDAFIEAFSDTFEKALNLRATPAGSSTIRFVSNDGLYNDFVVDFDFNNYVENSKKKVKVKVTAGSDYKFKTKYLKEAQNIIASQNGVYRLEYERTYTLEVVN